MLEATLRILCMTDGKEGMHTLEKQEEFLEIVKSRDVEVHLVNSFLRRYSDSQTVDPSLRRKRKRKRMIIDFFYRYTFYRLRIAETT